VEDPLTRKELRALQDRMGVVEPQLAALTSTALYAETDYSAGDHRVTRVAEPQAASDAATRNYVDRMSQGFVADLATRVLAQARYGTHAARLLVAPAPLGALFVETDRQAIYQARNGVWVWVGGGPVVTTLAALTTGLGANDAGFLNAASDFDRVYRWTGAAWADAPGQPGRGFIAFFPASIHADFIPGAGWQLCDGSTVTRSTPTGGSTSVTVPNLTGSTRFLRSVAGATGGVGGSATTHTHTTTATGTVSQPTFAGNAVAAASTAATPDLVAADTTAAGVAPVTTATGTVSQPTFTGNAVASGAPSGGGDDGLPPYYNARPYIRL